MKPNEFDELIRRKFDQNDFEYNPANWDRLDDRMDKKATRRKILMWLPLAPIAYISSVAASLAMIISIPVLMQHNTTSTATQHTVAVTHTNTPTVSRNNIELTNLPPDNIKDAVADNKAGRNMNVAHEEKISKFTFSANTALVTDLLNDITNKEEANTKPQHKNTNSFSRNDFVYGTADERYRHNKGGQGSISLIGGFNYGASTNVFSIGANAKKMLTDKLYVEGDIAFVDNSGIQNKLDPSSIKASYSMPIQTQDNTNGGSPSASGSMAMSPNAPGAPVTTASVINNSTVPKSLMANARIASNPTTDVPPSPVQAMPDIHRIKYDLYYAQFAPAVGYHLHKNLSVGVGADVQRLLQGENNLSTNPSATTAADIAADNKLVPGFDVGLVGKTEVTVTNKIKASVYYRQGMNNVIAPGNKFIDRSYMQIYLRFTIFGK